jgi:L-ribulose-5-phosphate 3-epimerase
MRRMGGEPTNPRDLGQGVPIDKGKVDFPRIIAGLKMLDYRGAVTIEKEISGPQPMEDVRTAKAYLEKPIGNRPERAPARRRRGK